VAVRIELWEKILELFAIYQEFGIRFPELIESVKVARGPYIVPQGMPTTTA
jgi:hypothetical protein